MVRERSSAGYILKALIPYSDANLKLLYKPSAFFYELEKISQYKKASLQNSFYQLKRKGLVELIDGVPHVTKKGYAKLQVYQPAKLQKSCLMVIFDIPERDRRKRQQLRTLLRELRFTRLQQSVWVSEYDARDYLKAEVQALRLKDHVQIFESHHLTL